MKATVFYLVLLPLAIAKQFAILELDIKTEHPEFITTDVKLQRIDRNDYAANGTVNIFQDISKDFTVI